MRSETTKGKTREEDVAQGGWDSALGATHCTRPAVLGAAPEGRRCLLSHVREAGAGRCQMRQ